MKENRWLLPEGVEEVLPEAAKRLDDLRRQLLDLYLGWGYELVIPPLIEYLESLLTATGRELDLQTFKLTDQLSGRMMGVRADMTPQAARIESVALNRGGVTRLCYIGTVLRARPVELGGSRSPLQVGAELYGHRGPESDVEIISLMMASLDAVGVDDVLLDLGHVGVFRGLVEDAGLDEEAEAELFDIMQRKSVPELGDFLDACDASEAHKRLLAALCEMNGEITGLEAAMAELAAANATVQRALRELQSVAALLRERTPGLNLHFDLAELRGYRYHTGVVFAAYSIGRGKAIAQGGRYDNLGHQFGRRGPRPATGFSADLKQWVRLSGETRAPLIPGIIAPWDNDPRLRDKVAKLRKSGERVVQDLSGDGEVKGCDRRLKKTGDDWQVVPIVNDGPD